MMKKLTSFCEKNLKIQFSRSLKIYNLSEKIVKVESSKFEFKTTLSSFRKWHYQKFSRSVGNVLTFV